MPESDAEGRRSGRRAFCPGSPDEVAGSGDGLVAAVGVVEDEARAGTIIRLNSDDLRRDLGFTVGPVGHCARAGADVSGGGVRVIDAPVQPGRRSSRREESTERRRLCLRPQPGARQDCCCRPQ